MARTYEATFIFSSTLDESALEQEIAKVEELVGKESGTVKEWNKWGRRRLAYEIKGQSDGFYAFLKYEADPEVLERLERVYRLNESILRYMNICTEE